MNSRKLGKSVDALLESWAFWLLGFLAFRLLVGLCGFWWLFGFGFSHPLRSSSSSAGRVLWFMQLLAAWLFASSAFQFLFGRSRFGFCGFSLVYAAFGGFGFSHPLLSQFLSGRFCVCTLSLVFWIWLPASSASPVFSLIESSLLRTSWGSSPPPTCYFLDCLQSNCTPI